MDQAVNHKTAQVDEVRWCMGKLDHTGATILIEQLV